MKVKQNKAYILSTCSTCQRIMEEIQWTGETQNIKEKNIDAKSLDALAKVHGSYEALFSKRAIKYRSLGLNAQELNEMDYRSWMLKEYTFLKRPFIIIGEKSFIGNAKKTIEEIKNHLVNE